MGCGNYYLVLNGYIVYYIYRKLIVYINLKDLLF